MKYPSARRSLVVGETRNTDAVAEFELLFNEIGSITSLLNLLTLTTFADFHSSSLVQPQCRNVNPYKVKPNKSLPKFTDHLKQSLFTSKAILKERKAPSSKDMADAQRSMDIAKERGMTGDGLSDYPTNT
ncbi:hypothetical protein DPMN_054640 [Dreissena polymorpha]|uniref:Uncharacterized protein n=1 Tax=Dreissena polymorpha TaxID=45954 RepID=A0A9D4HRT7_DREPO|nr:hypothetical protein DPMN_054640 [Dreissena polymorpha]